MASITKDTIIGDILDMDQTTAPFFLEMGMHCLGCPTHMLTLALKIATVALVHMPVHHVVGIPGFENKQ